MSSFHEKISPRCKLGRVASSYNSSVSLIFSAGLGGVEGKMSPARYLVTRRINPLRRSRDAKRESGKGETLFERTL